MTYQFINVLILTLSDHNYHYRTYREKRSSGILYTVFVLNKPAVLYFDVYLETLSIDSIYLYRLHLSIQRDVKEKQ